ncbi:MAG: OmpA family protein [Aquificae bacterium]|nr:OmpA family protein [Aquificota bacterium]
MKTFKIFLVSIAFSGVLTTSKGEITVTELLDEAQNSIKSAFESGCPEISPYEYAKAETYYKIANEETSKLYLLAGKAAALKSIDWALKAIAKRYGEETDISLKVPFRSLNIHYEVSVKDKKINPAEAKIFSEFEILKEKIENLYTKHALECAPENIAKAEVYLSAVAGIDYQDPETGEMKKIKLKRIDQIIFLNKAKKYIALARQDIYSDKDKDGIPCYQEIEQGTNPNISDLKKEKNIEEKIVKEIKIEKEEKPLKVQARIHFDFNKYNIKREYLPYLNVISRYLKANEDLKVKIIGYTDNIGSKEYNEKLAYKRAKAVRDYLIKMGISPSRIEILGKGKEDYLFDNKNWLNRFTNRRAEFFVMEVKTKEK